MFGARRKYAKTRRSDFSRIVGQFEDWTLRPSDLQVVGELKPRFLDRTNVNALQLQVITHRPRPNLAIFVRVVQWWDNTIQKMMV
jgi:hypothetical protein